jgi:Tol biopolymer transport system component
MIRRASLTALAVLGLTVFTVLANAHGAGAPATNWAIAYIAAYDAKGVTHNDLFITTANGAVTRQLTNDTVFKDCPAWSPDGMRIAFVSMQVASRGDNGTGGLYSIKPDGTGLTLLFDFGSSPNNIVFDSSSQEHISWSPDGKFIVFSGWGPNIPCATLYALDVAKGTVQNLLAAYGCDGNTRAPAWSPFMYSDATGSHSRISFSGSDGITAHVVKVLDVTVAPDGSLATGGITNLTNPSGDDVADSSWSPDGAFITFGVSGTGTSSGLFRMHSDGTNIQRMGGYTYVTWSPVGGYWAYLGGSGSGHNTNNEIFRSRTDFTGAVNLTNSTSRNEREPSWNPAWVNDL